MNTDAATDQNGLENNDNFPDVVADQKGHFIVAWQRGPSPPTEYDIRGARSDDLGLTWTAPSLVNTNGATDVGADSEPRLAVDTHGHWLAAWNSTENLGGTIGTDRDILAAPFLIPDSSGPGTSFCYGFRMNGNRCPCGNDWILGCANSTGFGASCVLSGAASLGGAPCSALGQNMPPNTSALYFQGTGVVGSGEGAAFGDGLRCAGGAVARIATVTNNGFGSSSVTLPKTGLAGGDVRAYQIWYRNAAVFCTASTFNLSSGLLATWVP